MLHWAVIRYQHTAAVGSRLLDRYAPATANRILSALRVVLEQIWLLGQMSAEDYSNCAPANACSTQELDYLTEFERTLLSGI
jgi:hypothetical protein